MEVAAPRRPTMLVVRTYAVEVLDEMRQVSKIDVNAVPLGVDDVCRAETDEATEVVVSEQTELLNFGNRNEDLQTALSTRP